MDHERTTPRDATPERERYEEPRLEYVAPRLSDEGRAEEVTLQGFFGTFSP